MIEFSDVVVGALNARRLDQCSFAARQGEVLALVGRTASGKTSALQVAAGFLAPSRGRVLLSGQDVTRRQSRLRKQCAYVGETLPGPDDLTVHRWLEVWMALDGVSSSAFKKRLPGALELFKLPPPQTRVAHLSQGQQRLLAFVRAWCRDPQVLLIDSPSQGLDGAHMRSLGGAILEASAAGKTVLITDSAPHLVAQIADRVICLEAGRCAQILEKSAPDFAQNLAAAQGWQA